MMTKAKGGELTPLQLSRDWLQKVQQDLRTAASLLTEGTSRSTTCNAQVGLLDDCRHNGVLTIHAQLRSTSCDY